MRGGPARHYVNAAVTALTLGRENQSFLGARPIAALLHAAPARSRRRLALSILSLSPHYFYRRPEYNGLSHAEFIEREFDRNRTTRQKLGELILGSHLEPRQIVLDYGCGPGFLMHYVAGRAKAVYGVDVSHGVLECARVITREPNAVFVHTSDIEEIGDATIDLAYSVAVAQHLTDSALADVLDTVRRKLKPSGQLLLHVVLDAEGWRTEAEWKRDVSIRGQLKLKYGLNCFTRSERQVRDLLETAGFASIVIRPMGDICAEPFDDVCTQHLVCAKT